MLLLPPLLFIIFQYRCAYNIIAFSIVIVKHNERRETNMLGTFVVTRI